MRYWKNEKIPKKSFLALLLAVLMVATTIAPSLTRAEEPVPSGEIETESTSEEYVPEFVSEVIDESGSERETIQPESETVNEPIDTSVYNDAVINGEDVKVRLLEHEDDVYKITDENRDRVAEDTKVIDDIKDYLEDRDLYDVFDIDYVDEYASEHDDDYTYYVTLKDVDPVEDAVLLHFADGWEYDESKIEEIDYFYDKDRHEVSFTTKTFSPFGFAEKAEEPETEEIVEETTTEETMEDSSVTNNTEAVEETAEAETTEDDADVRTVFVGSGSDDDGSSETEEVSQEDATSQEETASQGETVAEDETETEAVTEATIETESYAASSSEDVDVPGTYFKAIINGQEVNVRVMERASETYDYGDNSEIIRQDDAILTALDEYLDGRAIYKAFDIKNVNSDASVYHVVINGIVLPEDAVLLHLVDGWQSDTSKIEELEFIYNADRNSVSFNTSSFSPFAFVEKAAEEEPETEAGTTVDLEEMSDLDFVVKSRVSALGLHGKLAVDTNAAVDKLADESGLTEVENEGNTANEIARNLVNDVAKAADDSVESEIPRQLDGSNIESISVRWMTEDTVDNGSDEILYVKPSDDSKQRVRLRVNYALSGQHNYEAGDIMITVPAYIFKDRNGKDYGTMVIPYPEDPSTKQDFNWKLVGDNYVLTNTRRMSAATKGYIEFGIYDLIPHELVDMQETAPFDAYIEVVTHAGNLIALRSNSVTAQFDTEAKITAANKRQYNETKILKASDMPQEVRNKWPDEEYFVVVSWYMWAYRYGNTMYTIDVEDTIDDEYQQMFRPFSSGNWHVTDNGDGSYTAVYNEYLKNYTSDRTGYLYADVVYPISQFKPDTNYDFHNKVKYTLTEVDPQAENKATGEVDPQLVTTAEADGMVRWSYSDPKWQDPTGHFMIWKNGNDNDPTYYTHKYTYTYNDHFIDDNGYYGIYPAALNHLRDGKDVELSYTIDTLGYQMPWTYDPQDPVTAESSRIKSNYFRRPLTVTTTDTGLTPIRNGAKLTPLQDYDFKSVEVSTFSIMDGVPHNINEDGSWTAKYAGDGTFLYSTDNDLSHRPDVTIEVQRNNSDTWEKVATVSWQSGSQVSTLVSGEAVDGNVIPLPTDTTNIRSIVTSSLAGIHYDLRVNVALHPTDLIRNVVTGLFEHNYTPSMPVWNGAKMDVDYGAEDTHTPNAHILTIEKDGYDSLRGYTTDLSVFPSKTADYSVKEVDYDNNLVHVHFTGKVEERSFIADRATYEDAIASGELKSENHGIWYDLLPKGVTPLMDTIKLRDKDTITKAYTIGDYKGTGRTLLVVEADLTPVTTTYKPSDVTYYEDMITITFEATYDFVSMVDYGKNIHNVIAFESSKDVLGSVENYKGELDNLTTNNNVVTAKAFEDDAEKEAMTDLNPNRNTPSFVYAGTYVNLDVETAARVSLQKEVQTNRDGWWSSGLYYKEPDQNKRTVYTGGIYQYRLRMMPDSNTQTKNMIIYDSLENFKAGQGNDEIDINAATWRGELISVDVSQLREAGCAPVVYYSLVDNLQLSDETNPKIGNPTNMNLSDPEIWVPATSYTGDMAKVHAIAIDMSKRTDGTAFVLDEQESAVVIVNMRAPSGEDATKYISQKGAWGDSAMAYNNVYLTATTIDRRIQGSEVESNSFVRKDYTKVGLEEYSLVVTKVWDDGENRDGKRPDEITLHLYRNDVDTGLVKTLKASDDPYEVKFENIPYCDPEGNAYIYTIKEDSIDGYKASYSAIKDGVITVTNKHEPERVSVDGQKTWVGDEGHEDARPTAIQVLLYANGNYIQQQTIRPDKDGNWSYSFKNLYKYMNGKEVEYTVEERISEVAGKSYTTEVAEDGRTLVNTYHPFGEMYVTKTVKDTTDASANVEFELTFSFVKGTGDDAVPVTDEMPYVITEEKVVEEEDPETHEMVKKTVSEEVATGTVTCDSVLKIKGGQTIHITEIPEYVNYSVKESKAAGFTPDKDTFTGTIQPNGTSRADFVNTYAANGRFQMEALKTLKNRELKTYQFRFELFELVEGDDGKMTSKSIRTATSSRPTETVYVDTETNEGPVDHSNAPVTFGAIRYTQKDVGEHVYYLRETNTGKHGYIYDESIYEVKVTVVDNADGTLGITKEVSKIIVPTNPETEKPIPVTIDFLTGGYEKEALEGEAKPEFVNEYKAEGELTLRAWKTLKGRDLKDGEFSFVLMDEEGNIMKQKDSETEEETDMIVTNKADGTVVFPALKYTQADIGKTYHYAIREQAGSDPTVNYDGSVYGYQVTVYDNGDGTLSFSQTPATPIVEEEVCSVCDGSGCEACGGTGKIQEITGWNSEEGELPVFKNTLKNGSLSVSKYVENPDGADPNQTFTFKVVLIGEDGTVPDDGMITEFELSQAPERENPGRDADTTASTQGNESN